MLYFAIPADYLATSTGILTIKRVVMYAFLKLCINSSNICWACLIYFQIVKGIMVEIVAA